jgi:hypothetical protein
MPTSTLEINPEAAASDSGGVRVKPPQDAGNMAVCRDCEGMVLRANLISVDLRFYTDGEKPHRIPLRLCKGCCDELKTDMEAIAWSNDFLFKANP